MAVAIKKLVMSRHQMVTFAFV